MTIQLEIERAGKSLIRHRVPAFGVTTIGSSPAGGLAVPEAPELAREHLLVEPEDRGCRVLVLPGTAPARLRGLAFEEGFVPFGEPLCIGELQLRFRRTQRTGPSPIVLGSLVILCLYFGRAGWTHDSRAFASIPDPPELVFERPSCPSGTPSSGARGRELEEQALASAERYPFDVRDGLDAARQFAAASACYTQAGEGAAAARTARAHAAWAQRLQERYRAHRLRLRLAFERGQTSVARKQVPALLALLEAHAEHPYVRWLDAIDANR